ncbi:MAG: hypothetical protein ACR2O1_09075 [Boseongicola sp.]
MDNVIQFRPVEIIFMDAAHLTELAKDRGSLKAEYIADTALEEIAGRLTTAEAAWASGEFSRLQKIARLLVGMSEQMGMETLSMVAAMVSEAAASSDDVAVAALVRRLVHVGEGSLSAIWDIGHLRI